MDLGLDALSQITIFSKYAKYIPELKRRETWDEIVDRYQEMMIKKYSYLEESIIESAKFNKGKNKLYRGVAGNLVAYGCKMAFEKKYDGVVSFIAKTQLIEHYEQTLGAKLFGGNRMFIDTKESLILTTKYFKDFKL